LDKALECYDKAIELNPLEMIYYSNKAAVLTNMKKYDEVMEVLDLALEKY